VRPDKYLTYTVIADCSPGRAQPRTECCFRDNSSQPHGIDEFILADDSIAVPDQVDEQIKDLWFDWNGLPCSPQFIPGDVNFEVRKKNFKMSVSLLCNAGPLSNSLPIKPYWECDGHHTHVGG
jgi:hypothetical protein